MIRNNHGKPLYRHRQRFACDVLIHFPNGLVTTLQIAQQSPRIGQPLFLLCGQDHQLLIRSSACFVQRAC